LARIHVRLQGIVRGERKNRFIIALFFVPDDAATSGGST
jgi:hypothetical protein